MALPSFVNGGIVLILAAFYNRNVAGNDNSTLLMPGSSCIPADEEPVINSTKYCYPLVKLDKPFCEHYGIKLDKYVNLSTNLQQYWNDRLWMSQKQYEQFNRIGENISATYECSHHIRFLGCYYMFPSCDRTTSEYRPMKICKKSCESFLNECHKFFNAYKEIYLSAHPDYESLFSCLEQPSRNAGDSPECLYYHRVEHFKKEVCLYLDGSSYHGNISVTTSGIPCQSWTEQCPHRHTMNKTYPELTTAKNYCRNPQSSGKQPWCFTTDRNKRWEYCDIPKCIPVNGHYGNWSLNSTCNVTCGKGFERWSRECNSPVPKYGGRNCSHLGEPAEFRPCTKKSCAVNGGYSSWYVSNKCSVTCGHGVEIWQRSCDNPTPKNGGQNCTVLGKNVRHQICKRQHCPIGGNYSKWTKSLECSVTCGMGYEIWYRKCDNPPPKYGGDCSKQGKDRESRPCHQKSCPATSNSAKLVGIVCGTTAPLIIIAIVFVIWKRRTCIAGSKRRERFSPYAFCAFERIATNNFPIDDTTGENLYEEISESVGEINRLTTEEPAYENQEQCAIVN